ncbi:MAG: hypothetical protein CMJ76_12610 [Planctomycetaceae bacterium]|nr:hypothetical protein [Planctomycetaceae bacterium]
MTMINAQLLSILRCPVTASMLSEANPKLIQTINQRIEQNNLLSQIMEQLETPLDGGLVNQDHSLLMPVYEGIPDMNPDDAISLKQLEKTNSDE